MESLMAKPIAEDRVLCIIFINAYNLNSKYLMEKFDSKRISELESRSSCS
jgi:hypothetical protein